MSSQRQMPIHHLVSVAAIAANNSNLGDDDIIELPVAVSAHSAKNLAPISAQSLRQLVSSTSLRPNQAPAPETVLLLHSHSNPPTPAPQRHNPAHSSSDPPVPIHDPTPPGTNQASLLLISQLALPRLQPTPPPNIHTWLSVFETACRRVGVPQADWPASVLFHVSPDLFPWIVALQAPAGVAKHDEWRLVHRPALVQRFDRENSEPWKQMRQQQAQPVHEYAMQWEAASVAWVGMPSDPGWRVRTFIGSLNPVDQDRVKNSVYATIGDVVAAVRHSAAQHAAVDVEMVDVVDSDDEDVDYRPSVTTGAGRDRKRASVPPVPVIVVDDDVSSEVPEAKMSSDDVHQDAIALPPLTRKAFVATKPPSSAMTLTAAPVSVNTAIHRVSKPPPVASTTITPTSSGIPATAKTDPPPRTPAVQPPPLARSKIVPIVWQEGEARAIATGSHTTHDEPESSRVGAGPGAFTGNQPTPFRQLAGKPAAAPMTQHPDPLITHTVSTVSKSLSTVPRNSGCQAPSGCAHVPPRSDAHTMELSVLQPINTLGMRPSSTLSPKLANMPSSQADAPSSRASSPVTAVAIADSQLKTPPTLPVPLLHSQGATPSAPQAASSAPRPAIFCATTPPTVTLTKGAQVQSASRAATLTASCVSTASRQGQGSTRTRTTRPRSPSPVTSDDGCHSATGPSAAKRSRTGSAPPDPTLPANAQDGVALSRVWTISPTPTSPPRPKLTFKFLDDAEDDAEAQEQGNPQISFLEEAESMGFRKPSPNSTSDLPGPLLRQVTPDVHVVGRSDTHVSPTSSSMTQATVPRATSAAPATTSLFPFADRVPYTANDLALRRREKQPTLSNTPSSTSVSVTTSRAPSPEPLPSSLLLSSTRATSSGASSPARVSSTGPDIRTSTPTAAAPTPPPATPMAESPNASLAAAAAATLPSWRLRILTSSTLAGYFGPGIWTYTSDPHGEHVAHVRPRDPWSTVVRTALRAARVDAAPAAYVWLLTRVRGADHGALASSRRTLTLVPNKYHLFARDMKMTLRDVVAQFGVDVEPMFALDQEGDIRGQRRGDGRRGDAAVADVFVFIEQMPATRAGLAWSRFQLSHSSMSKYVPVFVKVYDPPRSRRYADRDACARGKDPEMIVSDFRTLGLTVMHLPALVPSLFAAIRVLNGASDAGREQYWLWIEAEVSQDAAVVAWGKRVRETAKWSDYVVPWGGVILAREIDR